VGIPSRSRLLRWSAAVVVLGLLGLGGAELFFRSFPDYLPVAAQFRVHDRALTANPINSLPNQELGYLWRPHVEARYRGFEFGFDYSTDAHGFRNPGPWPDRAEIVVLGDSEAFGFGVDDGEEWVRQLAQRMPGLDVVNLGLLGAAPQQFEKIYQAYGRPLRPDVVLVALFPSNAVTMAALFDQWEADGKPDRYDLRRARGGAPADQDALTVLRDRLRDSYAVLALHHGLRSLFGVDGLHTMTFADGGQVRLVEERYAGTAAAAARRDPSFTGVIDTLERLQAAIRADGAEMLVLPFPTKEEVHLPLLGLRAHELVPSFRRALEERGIPCLDLTPALQREAAAGRNLFLEVDLHPNAEGEAVIAGLVSDYLERTPAGRVLADGRR
jgi:lysophospholipase L1-like esterase